MPTNPLAADAKNRAARTFIQGLVIDVAVALCGLILLSINDITTRQGLVVLGVAAIKTVLTTVASYVMRRFVDGSAVPTPLPPAVAGVGTGYVPPPAVAPAGPPAPPVLPATPPTTPPSAA